MKKKILFLGVCLLILLVGCQTASESNPTDTTIDTPAGITPDTQPPTPIPQLPTATVAAPAVVINTPTAIPTATASVLPENTEVPPEATTVTQIPGLIGPDNFPANVNPLTGEVVSDPAILAHRPVAIKISNYPPVVRPQSGLNNADLLFEHYAEGGVTRFTAIFYGKEADPVGSVRSGRIIDLEIPQMFDAAFAYSGASGPVREMFRDSSFFSRIISPDFGHGGFYRIEDPNKAFEHTLFTGTSNLRFILGERGENVPPVFNTNMAFHPDVPAGSNPADSIQIQYIGTNAFWQYEPTSQRYLRWTDGTAHVDANTGAQLNFRNVIILGAHHEDTDILEDLVGGGNYSIQIQIWGEGPVSIFRDGQRIEGMWRRANPGDMVTFYDLDGNILPLAPGNSFIQLVPLGFTGLSTTP